MSDNSLRQGLTDAAQVLASILDGQSIDSALSASDLPPERKRVAQGLVFETYRNIALAEALCKVLTAKPPKPLIKALILVALVQLQTKRREEFTIVNEAVQAVKKLDENPKVSGFVNAVLRRFCRERQSLVKRCSSQENVRFNAPSWWIKKYREALGEKADTVFKVQRQHPPLCLRINKLKTTMDAYLKMLQENGIKALQVGANGIVLDSPVPVERIPGFFEGLVSVQDIGSQLAADILDAKDGMRVLDACAAPGGKTGHIAEKAKAQILALEIDPSRAEKIKENMERLSLECEVRVADAADVKSWWNGEPFDRILLDAPCTASGIVRRQPDIPWSRQPGDIDKLAKMQKRLLERLWPLLKKGGRLLYAVCSVFPQEGETQIARFLEGFPDAELVPFEGAPTGQLRLIPTELRDADGKILEVHDGFFYALLEKK